MNLDQRLRLSQKHTSHGTPRMCPIKAFSSYNKLYPFQTDRNSKLPLSASFCDHTGRAIGNSLFPPPPPPPSPTSPPPSRSIETTKEKSPTSSMDSTITKYVPEEAASYRNLAYFRDTNETPLKHGASAQIYRLFIIAQCVTSQTQRGECFEFWRATRM